MNSNNFINLFPIRYRKGSKEEIFKDCFPDKKIAPIKTGGLRIDDLAVVHYECQDDIKYFRVRYFDYIQVNDCLATVFHSEKYYLRNRDEDSMLDDIRIHFRNNNKIIKKRNMELELKKFKEGIDEYD